MEKSIDMILEIYTSGLTNMVKYIPIGTTVSLEIVEPCCIGKVKLKHGTLPIDEPVIFERLKLNRS